MRFLHVGDLHIGKSLGDFDLYDDQKHILNQIVDIAIERNVDAILMAGDIYDKSIPSEAAVRLFNEFILRLVEHSIKTFVISGNHDSDERLNFGSELFASSNVFIAAKFTDKLYKQVVTDENGSVNIYLMPFVKASQVKHAYPDAEINTYEDAVRVLLENSDIDDEQRNVLVAHQFVAGKMADPQLGGSEGLATRNVGTVERIGSDCFDMFDYVALGHIHSGQKVGRDEVRYAGSPLKYSLSEASDTKSVPVVTIAEKGAVSIELVELTPYRELRHIKGKLEKLLSSDNVLPENDFIYVTLTDEDPINDVMGIFQSRYRNTVKIDYDNSRTREVEQVDTADIADGRTFVEMISDFYKQMYGLDITEEELKLMREIAREAGVSDEAD